MSNLDLLPPAKRGGFTEQQISFIVARLVIILGLTLYIISRPGGTVQSVLAWILLFGVGLYLGVYGWLASSKKINLRDLNRITFFVDIVAISIFCLATGGLQSPFYVLLYLVVAYAAYTLNLIEALIFSFLATFLYLILHLGQLAKVDLGVLFWRIGLIWFIGGMVSIFAKEYQESQSRLKKTLNTLTQRTQETERSKLQIESIYESSRQLAKLMSLEQIIEKILSIVREILGHKNFSILLLSPEGDALELRAKIEGGKITRYDQIQRFNLTGVWGEVVRNVASERVLDVQSDPREVLAEKKDTRAQLSVPLVVGGKVFGILNCESQNIGAFLDQDEKTLTILANHAALAIENFQLHSKTEELTVIDELTGASNYRYFRQKLDEEFKRAKRYTQLLSMIMMDIDWFKRCNDTYGHRFGNQVLRELVRISGKHIRDVDVLCRYGGEEFVVILPQTGKEDARQIAERIRVAVGQQLIELDKIKTRVTVSIGVATFPEDAEEPDQLIEKVDQALYQAKGHGKNQVWAQPPLVASK